MAVASAGPYANHLQYLTLDRYPCQHLTIQFFTGRMLFLKATHNILLLIRGICLIASKFLRLLLFLCVMYRLGLVLADLTAQSVPSHNHSTAVCTDLDKATKRYYYYYYYYFYALGCISPKG